MLAEADLLTAIDYAAGFRTAVAMLMHDRDDEVTTLEDLLVRPAWMTDAACREHPEVNFFPNVGQVPTAAIAVCDGCPVREECLAYAMDHGYELDGVWGATTARKRRQELLPRKAGRGGGRTTRDDHLDVLAFVAGTEDLLWRERLALWNEHHPERPFKRMQALITAHTAARRCLGLDDSAIEVDDSVDVPRATREARSA